MRTLSQLRLEVRTYLGESDSEAEPLWSNTYLNLWINRFIKLVAETTECLEGTSNITTVIGKGNYPLPSRHFKPLLVKSGTDVIKPIEVKDLVKIDTSTQGTPSRYMLFNNQIYLYPIPSAVATVSIWSTLTSEELAEDDESPLPEELDDIVIKMVLAKAKQQEEEYGVANQYYSEIPFNIADYLTKTITKQGQEPNTVSDYMGFGDW